MFDTAYFNASPFGPDDPTAQTSKLISGSWYLQGDDLSQNNPWLTQNASTEQLFYDEGGTSTGIKNNQAYSDLSGSNSPYLSGDVYTFGDGRAVPTEFLYGYNKFGIGSGNRNTLYQMVNWDQYKDIPGIVSPDKFAGDAFLQHWNTNQHGYTDDESSSGSNVLKNIANQFLNQDYFKNLRNGSAVDITQAPGWEQFAQSDAQRMGTAKAATQAMNTGSGAIISPGLQNFIQSSVMAWLGTGGWGTIGDAVGAAGSTGGSSAAATSGGTTMGEDVWGEFANYDGGGGDFGFTGVNELEAYDWGSQGYMGGNSPYLGSSPYDASGNWAGMNTGGNWQQVLQQGMRMVNQMQGSGGGNQGNGGYSLPLGQLLGGLMGLYGARQQSNTSRELMDRAAGAADPFASQRGFYADRLRQSYEDPNQIWDSPAWQTLRQKMLRESTAKDAAAGRLTDFGPRDQRVAESFMGDYLPKYQAGLMQPSGASGNPAAVAQALMAMSGQVGQGQANQSNALGYLLNNLLTGNQPSAVDRIFGGAQAMNDSLFDSLWKWYNRDSSLDNTYL